MPIKTDFKKGFKDFLFLNQTKIYVSQKVHGLTILKNITIFSETVQTSKGTKKCFYRIFVESKGKFSKVTIRGCFGHFHVCGGGGQILCPHLEDAKTFAISIYPLLSI